MAGNTGEITGTKAVSCEYSKIIDGVDLLSMDLGLSQTQRVFREQHDIFTDLEKQKDS
ncbi:hypothetical protein NUACC21_08400 [Scytonema sp. NUACC21]